MTLWENIAHYSFKSFISINDMNKFVNDVRFDRYSPYEIISVDNKNLIVKVFRID